MKSEIKLEVGRLYGIRNPFMAKGTNMPETVKIIGRSGTFFIGSDGNWYTFDGRCDLLEKSPFDLVREVTP